MKLSFATLLLLAGLTGAFAVAAIGKAPAPDGPMPLCLPGDPPCRAAQGLTAVS
jgi:hypothetical protein